jgi:hypothetical protein
MAIPQVIGQWRLKTAYNVLCSRQGRITPATIADHHPPHKGDWNKFRLGPCSRSAATTTIANGPATDTATAATLATTATSTQTGRSIGNDSDILPLACHGDREGFDVVLEADQVRDVGSGLSVVQ